MSSSVISQHCKKIQERNGITIEELKSLLDNIVLELNKLKVDDNNNDLFNNSLEELLNVSDNLDINHELFFIYRDTLITLFNKRNKLNEQEIKLLQKMTLLFYSIMKDVREKNVEKYKILFCNKTFIESIKSYVDDVAKNVNHFKLDTNLTNLNYIILGLNALQMKQKELQDDSILLILLDSLVNLICSKCYINTFKEVELKSSSLTIVQTFVLLTCPSYISNYDGKRVQDISEVMSNFLLPSQSLDILQRFTPKISKWTDVFIQYMSNFMTMLQYIVFGDTRKLYSHIHLKLIDHAHIILNGFTLEKIENETHLSNLILYTVVYLYSLTFDPSLLTYIKQKSFISTLLKLIEVNNHRIQVNAYRTIATLMSEDDVKRLENPGKITQVFINYIELFIDNMYKKTVLENTLLGLKTLAQHDQIKEELVKQNAIPLLIRCITETKFDVIKVQQCALEILWVMTFNEQAASILKNDERFMTHLKFLQMSNEIGVRKATNGIIWILEQEAQFISRKAEEEIRDIPAHTTSLYKYDIMISYSHADKDLCYRIQERLVRDKFRVWLDRDNLYGSQMQEMADAIENSEFVFICMSDTYKQSAYCQSEAHYAYERRCRLIPLKVIENYRPDGWLGFILSGIVYVDFSKRDFDTAYRKLKTEINRHRNQQSKKQDSHHHISYSSPTLDRSENISLNVSQKLKTYETILIQQWSVTNVVDFLIEMKLDAMIPLCEDMNGEQLYKMYKMCNANSDTMYQSLKAELNELQNKTLPLRVYIRFLDTLKTYVPEANGAKSMTCTLT